MQINIYWQGKQIQFPYRIYDDVSKAQVLTAKDLEILCIYTRHHNGHIREVAVLELMQKFPTECIPFVVQLIAEYVVEIITSINKIITPKQCQEIQEFLKENPKHAQTIQSKIASYWGCYFKWRNIKLKDYPAYKLINNV